MTEKIKVELGYVQKTLLLPLWGRAEESRKKNPKLMDNTAVEIIKNIDYDFSTISKNINWITKYSWVARSLHTDRVISDFIKKHPQATIVNIGCGLDTTFDRVDNGKIIFYELDLPDVIDLRKNFFAGNDRRRTISSSFLDEEWLKGLEIKEGILFIAAGVFYYFNEEEIKNFFTALSHNFDECEIFFDAASPTGVKIANKKVIEAGGMASSAILKWGIKSAGQIESWDHGIKLIKKYPMFKGMKKGFPLKMKYGLWLSDVLKILSMVHLQIGIRG